MFRISKKTALIRGFSLLVFLVVLVSVNTIYYDNYQTSLSSGRFVTDGSLELEANRWSVPVVYDWNDDGKKDLLIGNRTYRKDENINQGYISFYENTGTDANPSFSGHMNVKACTKTCVSLKVAADG